MFSSIGPQQSSSCQGRTASSRGRKLFVGLRLNLQTNSTEKIGPGAECKAGKACRANRHPATLIMFCHILSTPSILHQIARRAWFVALGPVSPLCPPCFSLTSGHVAESFPTARHSGLFMAGNSLLLGPLPDVARHLVANLAVEYGCSTDS